MKKIIKVFLAVFILAVLVFLGFKTFQTIYVRKEEKLFDPNKITAEMDVGTAFNRVVPCEEKDVKIIDGGYIKTIQSYFQTTPENAEFYLNHSTEYSYYWDVGMTITNESTKEMRGVQLKLIDGDNSLFVEGGSLSERYLGIKRGEIDKSGAILIIRDEGLSEEEILEKIRSSTFEVTYSYEILRKRYSGSVPVTFK
ncbi:MAG: hypothetical protein FWF05_06075 [Oscillospiraceae bacterium]|nr:hypothetical protein [Oscillospiraceae bacterium]